MEIRQLRYFCAVARMGTFTRAAESEGISQPSLSQQIVKLERELDAPLFERLGRHIKLTEYGRALLPAAVGILRQVNDARTALESVRGGVGGRLRVGCIPTITPNFLGPRIVGFTDLYPDVRLHLTEDITLNLIEKLLAGELDVAVASLPISNPEVVCSVLFREPILVALQKGHRWSGALKVDLSDLRQERLLLLKEGHCFRNDALGVCSRARSPFSSIFETDQFASIFSLVAAGYGISLVPATAARPETGCDFLPLDHPAVRRVAYLRARRHVAGNAQKAFVKWLRSIRPE